MQKKSEIRVIIDTNLWISFLIGKLLVNLKDLIVDGSIKIVVSKETLEEICLVTQKPKLKKYFPPEKVTELVQLLKTIGINTNITSEFSLCRDPKDNYLLALARDSKADFLVTGDQDLLIIKQFECTEIVTYQEFLDKLNHS